MQQWGVTTRLLITPRWGTWIPLGWAGCWRGLEPSLLGWGSVPVQACRDVTGQGRNKARTCCFSRSHPCMERGRPALGGLSREGDAALWAAGPRRGWQGGRTPKSTGAAGGIAAGSRSKTPQVGGNPFPRAGVTPGDGAHVCVCVPTRAAQPHLSGCSHAPTRGCRGSQEQTHSTAQTVKGGAEGTDVLRGGPDDCLQVKGQPCHPKTL